MNYSLTGFLKQAVMTRPCSLRMVMFAWISLVNQIVRRVR